MTHVHLKKTLGPLMIWGLGVGYVISGSYFGWNLGLPYAGTLGFSIAISLATIMYITFVFCYAEMACAMPKAGGAFVYVSRAFGLRAGAFIGFAQWIEYVFAPPAIAAAIGAYFSLFFPEIPAFLFSAFAYFIFTSLNIYGVKQSAMFEFAITVVAIVELFIFVGMTAPHFSSEAFFKEPFVDGAKGVLASLPYAIWFYLAIEGIANIAEETINPQKNISRGFISALSTLIVLTLTVFVSSVGVSGWRGIVYKDNFSSPSDSPLPLALAHIVGNSNFFYHMLITIGLFGLIASFHGILLAAGRALFALGQAGLAPKITAQLLDKRQTPAAALLVNMGIGCIALLTGKTGEIITIAVLGALTLYAGSMLSFLRLRKKEPHLERPFKAPFYPLFPLIALLLSLLFLVAIAFYQTSVFIIYLLLMIGSLLYHGKLNPQRIAE